MRTRTEDIVACHVPGMSQDHQPAVVWRLLQVFKVHLADVWEKLWKSRGARRRVSSDEREEIYMYDPQRWSVEDWSFLLRHRSAASHSTEDNESEIVRIFIIAWGQEQF